MLMYNVQQYNANTEVKKKVYTGKISLPNLSTCVKTKILKLLFWLL